MKRGRHDALGRLGRDRGGKIGVTLETDLPHHRARQHSRIHRTVRLMARRAALEAHWRVLEGKRPAFVAMTLETARLIGAKSPKHYCTNGAVRVVAVHASHASFRHAMA